MASWSTTRSSCSIRVDPRPGIQISEPTGRSSLSDVRDAAYNRFECAHGARTLGVLAQLLASGVSVERASQTVVALIRRGATAQQLSSLGNGVNEDVAKGDKAATALDIRVRGLSAILAPGGTGTVTVSSPAAAS